jgi:aminopeptidase N
MPSDAELPARDDVALVQSGIGGESDIGVVQSLLRQAQAALTQYADPAWAPVGRASLAASALEAVRSAEPGSDLQLAWTRALGMLASTDEQLGLVCALLDGSQQLPGLSVDAELRWHLLRRLLVMGRAGEAEIEAELQRDPTAAGQRHAAAGRASMPTEQAKADAWASVVDSDELPNAVQAAVIGGFAQPEQVELLEPFVDRYFAVVGDPHQGDGPEPGRRHVPLDARHPGRRREDRRLPGRQRRAPGTRAAAARGARRGGALAAGQGPGRGLRLVVRELSAGR